MLQKAARASEGGGVTTTPMPGSLIEEIIDEEMTKMNWDA